MHLACGALEYGVDRASHEVVRVQKATDSPTMSALVELILLPRRLSHAVVARKQSNLKAHLGILHKHCHKPPPHDAPGIHALITSARSAIASVGPNSKISDSSDLEATYASICNTSEGATEAFAEMALHRLSFAHSPAAAHSLMMWKRS